MTPNEVLQEMIAGFRGEGAGKPRKYLGGLLPSFCDFLLELDTPSEPFGSLSDFFAKYTHITDGVSTLTVQLADGNTKTIRPAYERHHSYFIEEHKRLDYPRSGPYATGKWSDYTHWLDALVGMSEAQLVDIRDRSLQFVLDELEDQSFDPSSVRVDPPVFRNLLSQFDFNDRAKGEPTGAAFQAMVFGYIRADAPHLQVEARKVRAGSSRTKGIGDIDAWEGDQLIISAEVKHFAFQDSDSKTITHFASSIKERAALGIVIAERFGEGARDSLDELGLISLDLADLIEIVRLWDPLKQRAAINAFYWVVAHIEQNSGLKQRVDLFLAESAHVS